MILDSFKLRRLIFQLRYSEAYELWDRAGAIARRVSRIWPGLKSGEAGPQQQILRGPGVEIQTGFTTASVALSGELTLDRAAIPVQNTFSVWRDELSLGVVARVSTRAIYSRTFPSTAQANDELRNMGLVRLPVEKVFDQPKASALNSFDVLYRFEDERSFALLRLNTEKLTYKVELDPEFVDMQNVEKTIHRLNIDFDRGVLGEVKMDQFSAEDWFKGFGHILRRDIEKVVKG